MSKTQIRNNGELFELCLGFGPWDLGFPEEMAKVKCTSRVAADDGSANIRVSSGSLSSTG
jgi:hypothetical protein